jgi:hypothetical protein
MNTRRAFFLSGGAAAVATTAGIPAVAQGGNSQQGLLAARDREAIREALAAVLARTEGWQDLSRRQDEITLLGRERATAAVHFEVEQCTPLEADCTAAQMARLQGNVADRSWVAHRVEVDFAKLNGEWKVSGIRER